MAMVHFHSSFSILNGLIDIDLLDRSWSTLNADDYGVCFYADNSHYSTAGLLQRQLLESGIP